MEFETLPKAIVRFINTNYQRVSFPHLASISIFWVIRIIDFNTGWYLKCPKKYVEEIFCTWWHLQKILKCPKIEQFQFFSFFCSKSDHVLNFWNAPLFQARIFWNAPFRINFGGHFKIFYKCHHVQNISSTYFLGHFKYHPVYRRLYQRVPKVITLWRIIYFQ